MIHGERFFPEHVKMFPLPRTVLGDSQYLLLFGLSKKVFSAYPCQFALRLQHADTEVVPEDTTTQLVVGIQQISEAKSIVPPPEQNKGGKEAANNSTTSTSTPSSKSLDFNVSTEADTGDIVIDYSPTKPGVLQVTLDWVSVKVLPAPEEEVVADTQAIQEEVRGMLRETGKSKKDAKDVPFTTRYGTEIVKQITVVNETGEEGKEKEIEDRYEVCVKPLFGGSQHVEVVEGVRQSITSSGGKLTLDGVTINIPEGALSDTTEISAHKKISNSTTWKRGFATMSLKSPIVMLQPHSLQFAKPVTLTMSYVNNNRYPRPSLGRLTFLYWLDESASWDELPGGKFSSGTATMSINSFSCYAVGSKSMTDASLMPVNVVGTNKDKAEILNQSKTLYENILPPRCEVKFVGGHQLLCQFSLLKDKKKEDKHLYPPSSLGFQLTSHRMDTLYYYAMQGKVDILSCVSHSQDKAVYVRLKNKTSQYLAFMIHKGTVFEQQEWIGHQNVIVNKDVELEMRGLQETLWKVFVWEATDVWAPAKNDDMNITPFSLDKPEGIKTQNKLIQYLQSKLDD
eukprot:TRINITY_DN62288_c0_g1_i1.p1 TRINITY_DN62288_c0_g1~~TRINITY_DN62288_c0_g1_i1.p1  ORF type:complete len:568 (+),score=34.97 TRINITY_DN62288_c0_g1_i1:68-1771(+)